MYMRASAPVSCILNNLNIFFANRRCRGFGVTVSYAKAAILTYDRAECIEKGIPFPEGKAEEWFGPERARYKRMLGLKPREITQEQAYQDYIKQMSVPGEYDETVRKERSKTLNFYFRFC